MDPDGSIVRLWADGMWVEGEDRHEDAAKLHAPAWNGSWDVFKGCSLPIGFGLDPQNLRQVINPRYAGYEFADI